MHLSLGILVGLSLAACGSDGGAGNDAAVNDNPDASTSIAVATLSIATQPVSSAAGDSLTISVEARDSNDALIADATGISLSIATNPASGTLGGTVTQMTADGVATFDDVFVDKAGLGYTVLATSGSVTAETSAFDIVAGPYSAMSFTAQPTDVEAMAPMAAPVTVELQDAFGNLVSDATADVTVRFASNPGEMLARSSGNGPAILEHLDPVTLQSVGWYESFFNLEARGMLINPNDGLFYVAVRSDSDVFSLDLGADQLVNLGQTAISLRGLVFDPTGTGRFLSLDFESSTLVEVDFVTATSTSLGAITATPAIESFAGLTVDPTTGTYYAIALTTASTRSDRRLVTIDPVGLTATEIGTFSDDGVASLTFRADGTLLAITGDGATVSSSVFTVDKATAIMTLVGAADNRSGDGECIAIVPARLLGTTTVTAVDGIATFDGLRVDASATGFTLEAVAGDVVSAPSAAFDVSALQGIAGVVTLDAAVQAVAEDVGTVDVAVSIDLAQTHDVVLTYAITGTAGNLVDSDVSEERFFNVVISAGQTTASRSLTIVDDVEAEGPETIVLTLQNVAMADEAGAISEQTITITDND